MQKAVTTPACRTAAIYSGSCRVETLRHMLTRPVTHVKWQHWFEIHCGCSAHCAAGSCNLMHLVVVNTTTCLRGCCIIVVHQHRCAQQALSSPTISAHPTYLSSSGKFPYHTLVHHSFTLPRTACTAACLYVAVLLWLSLCLAAKACDRTPAMKACRSRRAAQGKLLGCISCAYTRLAVRRVVPVADPRETQSSALFRGSISSLLLTLFDSSWNTSVLCACINTHGCELYNPNKRPLPL